MLLDYPVYRDFPYIDRQCFGAAIGIFVSVFVLNLRHFRGVLRIARRRTGEDADEPIPIGSRSGALSEGLSSFLFSPDASVCLFG